MSLKRQLAAALDDAAVKRVLAQGLAERAKYRVGRWAKPAAETAAYAEQAFREADARADELIRQAVRPAAAPGGGFSFAGKLGIDRGRKLQ